MARVLVVPGLAVHAYAELPVRHLRDNGHEAELLEPPAWRGVDHDLELYGQKLAADIDHDGAPVDVLIGLSIGTQAAAVAASLTSLVRHLVLVSPTIDPAYRSMIKQAAVFFLRGDPHDKATFFSQLPDWSRAGVRRIFRGFALRQAHGTCGAGSGHMWCRLRHMRCSSACKAGIVGDLDAKQVVASFDSASVLHAATASALEGQPFRNLGSSAVAGLAVRAAGRLPWAVLRGIYTRIGASEGINPRRLGDVDLDAVATSFAGRFPKRRYRAVLLGASNGALTHLAATMQVPWRPDTVLIPVAHVGDTDRPDEAMEFGRSVAPALLDRNADIVLHHMHDQLQDVLMAERMSYFRVKWRRLPKAYANFIENHLAADGTVVLINDHSTWPVTRIGPRHVFQAGGRGGADPEEYLERPHAPAPNDEAVESEWGLDPDFRDHVRAWCEQRGHRFAEISYGGPQARATAVATVTRNWYRARGESANRLVVPCFILGDPWQTVSAAAVPFWIHFAVQPALQALDAYLEDAEPYSDVHVFLFQHGTNSPGIARPADFAEVISRHGARAHFDGLDPERFPHDIGTLGRYGPIFDQLPRARQPWSPMPVADALRGLADAGLSMTTTG